MVGVEDSIGVGIRGASPPETGLSGLENLRSLGVLKSDAVKNARGPLARYTVEHSFINIHMSCGSSRSQSPSVFLHICALRYLFPSESAVLKYTSLQFLVENPNAIVRQM